MSDVTIPADVAKGAGEWLRDLAANVSHPYTRGERVGLVEVADLLDPPPKSLRDEATQAYVDSQGAALVELSDYDHRAIDAVLAVVKARIEALPVYGSVAPGSAAISRLDLLALFGEA